MKTYIRLPLMAIALSLSIAACKGNKSANAADSTKLDSMSTTKVDSSVKRDTSKKDSLKTGDTTKKVDTIKKTTVKTTEVKKTSAKKGE
jgi:hypothetical protein